MRAEPINESNLYLFHEGTQTRAYSILGAHPTERDGQRGTRFSVWAPHAENIWVEGDFNNWCGNGFRMERVGNSGVWSLFAPGVEVNSLYKYAIQHPSGEIRVKADPFAFAAELRPSTASRVVSTDHFAWTDDGWFARQRKTPVYGQPLNIYEVHLGSWRRKAEGAFLSYRELAFELVDYAVEMGYTHLELLPVAEHPLDGSWGYQQTGYFAVTSRYGSPEDFQFFVNRAHEKGIGVIVDWVPGHFCKDDHGLARFDGEPLYEPSDRVRAENIEWGTLNFELGSPEVRSFLISNAMFWFDVYHVDGLRVDAVANLLYLDFARGPGRWKPNKHGGRENLEAVDFLRKLNSAVFAQYPAALMIAEESTTWTGVTRPVHEGGLGFNYKWNMGWMNDMLRYAKTDPLFRAGKHNLVTFAMMYMYSENFILPLSHDEVVHGKQSLLDKMPGDYWQKFAGLRGFLGFAAAHPGKKLIFMGAEFGQFIEWDENRSLDWHLLGYELHAKLHLYVKELNHLYLSQPCLWETDHQRAGFRWINADDRNESIVSFVRYAADSADCLIVVCNFTPVGRDGYVIGVPEAGEYREIFNSDDARYGGSGALHSAPLVSGRRWERWSHSLMVGVPPLGFVCFKKV
ncbi:MAG: 1,4-alpha-glucan branching protein GlgB [Negativicutes bacterium]